MTTADDLQLALYQARDEAQAAGLTFTIDRGHGETLWLLYADGRLALTWLPRRKRAQSPDDSPSVRCAGWAEALNLALAAK